MKTAYITGVPGVGKSTIVNELRNLGYSAFDIDEISSWVNKETGIVGEYISGTGAKWIKDYTWTCDINKLQQILEKICCEKHVIFAGVTANQNHYLHLFDAVILLQCPEDIFFNRLISRKNNEYGKDEWQRIDILTWYKSFELGLINRNAIVVNANQQIHDVVKDIVEIIQ